MLSSPYFPQPHQQESTTLQAALVSTVKIFGEYVGLTLGEPPPQRPTQCYISDIAKRILLSSMANGSSRMTIWKEALQDIANTCEWHKPATEIQGDVIDVMSNVIASWGIPITTHRVLEIVTNVIKM